MGHIAHTATIATAETALGMASLRAKAQQWRPLNDADADSGLACVFGERGGWMCLCSTGSKSGWDAQKKGTARSRELIEGAQGGDTGWRAAQVSCAGADEEREGIQAIGPRVADLTVPSAKHQGLLELREAPERVFALFVECDDEHASETERLSGRMSAVKRALAWAGDRAEAGLSEALVNGYQTGCVGLDLRGLDAESALEESARFLLGVREAWSVSDLQWVASAQTARSWENIGGASLDAESYYSEKSSLSELCYSQARALAERGALRRSAKEPGIKKRLSTTRM